MRSCSTGLNIPVNLAVKIYNEYGDEVYDIVRTNPYKIAEDITGVGSGQRTRLRTDLVSEEIRISG